MSIHVKLTCCAVCPFGSSPAWRPAFESIVFRDWKKNVSKSCQVTLDRSGKHSLCNASNTITFDMIFQGLHTVIKYIPYVRSYWEFLFLIQIEFGTAFLYTVLWSKHCFPAFYIIFSSDGVTQWFYRLTRIGIPIATRNCYDYKSIFLINFFQKKKS